MSDKEIQDMQTICDILDKHDEDTRTRILMWLIGKFRPEKRISVPIMKPSKSIN